MEQVFDWLDAHADDRRRAGLSRQLRPRGYDSDLLDLAGNDYLGLARDKRVAGAAAAATLRWGAGATGSRLVTGTTELHSELEFELARFCGTQSALVFSSGFAANLGAVTALSGKNCSIVTDSAIHASLIDGCRLSRAEVAVVGHSDPAAAGRALSTRRTERAIYVTDSVFSVDGDLAPLAELAQLCRENKAALIVDDAHGLGVLGEGGRGAVPAAGLAGAPDVVTTVTLSKALGAQGGAVLGPRRVIKHLVENARSFIFDTGLAPSSVAAALSALNVLKEEPDRATRVLEVAQTLAERLKAAGLSVSDPAAAVVSVRAPSPDAALAWSNDCRAAGVWVGCFRPPSVPDSISRLRLTARADLTEGDIDRAVDVITRCAPR
ncbi:8-amino-7-oxononanoate synthase [Actinokineospora globicatena]|uniref:8-amino-7-oxononanoate synthase n=1 Tax=Actinokineospora globicatena TaxID=103729 RepID=A0A9W6VAN1_9PSEU|nr:8-amino-7-oxononanoate synthase [Actinokineospora globicatena]GLW81507.1 8-amino-7-oxononanoate synthase [Actinokineospora globicatena]GLW87795.1 8-amino-7-oxononanoate synthase [Actinokineospora globicatena]GLW94472.1 8-amino-7-oxononanoate synthase [Actinokineospora globicatena]